MSHQQGIVQDRAMTHSVVNYLNAAYQGKFAFQNVMLRLKHPEASEEELSKVKEGLNTIHNWMEALWRSECLFRSTWESPSTPEAQLSFDMLHALKPEISDLSVRLQKLLNQPYLADSIDDVKFVIACFARFAYAHENYIKGFIEFGTTFMDKQMLEAYTPQKEEAETAVKLLHEFIKYFTSNNPPSREFIAELQMQSLIIPGTFRCQIHDINIIVSGYQGEFSYELAKFLHAEAKSWASEGFSPQIAGYWRAFKFTPGEASQWMSAGITEVITAAYWKNAGFDPLSGISWMNAGFSPFDAKAWLDEGFTFDVAQEFIQKGITSPEQARQEQL